MYDTEKGYKLAKEFYAQHGIDVDKMIEIADKTPISMHCWQGDDVIGFEKKEGGLTGGIQTTGNYPGRATTPTELRADIEKAMEYIPGELKVNVHANYQEADKFVDRDAITEDNFKNWADWAVEKEFKSEPFALVWDYYCSKTDKGIGLNWLDEVRKYEDEVLVKR